MKDRDAGQSESRIERFADGSSLETCPGGSVVLREGGLAAAAAVRSEAWPAAVPPGRPVRYEEPVPSPEP